MTKEEKRWIDEADAYTLLHRNRFAGSEDAIFQGESGDYFAKRLSFLRREMGRAKWTALSKEVGLG